MPEISEIPERVYNLFTEGREALDEDNLEQFANNIKDLLRQRLVTSAAENEERTVLRFSNLGKPARQLWYMANKPEVGEPFTGKQLLKFLYGDIIEQMMVFLIKEAGFEFQDEQLEIEVDGIKGHLDGTINGTVVDVKSASPQAFIKFKNGTLFENDSFGYVDQISGYANVVSPDKGAAFIAFDKVHGDITTLGVGASIAKDFDVPARINSLREAIAQPEPPERCYEDLEDGKSGNRKLGTNCSYCAFKHECWPGLRTFIYSNGPRYLTKVEKTPDVPEV